MENQIEEVIVEQGSSKKGIAKVALIVTGVAAGVAGVIFWRKRKAKQLAESEVEVSEDSNESSEN